MIDLTIDGKTVQVPDGITVLQAAEAAGIHIPTLCNHPALKPFGGCRLCLVEVEGMRALQPSCTMPASDRMVILTGTDKVKAARRFVLNMIFSDRNHFCPYCQVSGADCELQNAALEEDMSHWSFPPGWERYPVDASHPYFVLDHNRCILCHRCVRACGQLVGNFTLGIEERGARSMLVADTGVPLADSSCVQCGTCVSVCPTGALIERNSAYQGHDEEMDVTQSICVGCSVGCGVQVYTRDNRLVRIIGDWDASINGGVLCKTGRFLPFDENRRRVEMPMVRKNGKLEPVTWDEALETVAAHLQPLSGKTGAGVAAAVSNRLPIEALSAFSQIFNDCLGSDMATSTEQGLSTAAAMALAAETGHPFEQGMEALKSADCVFAVESGLAEDHMVAGFFIKRNLPEGASLVMVEPEMNEMAVRANAFLKADSSSAAAVIEGVSAGLIRLGVVDGDAARAAIDLAAAAKSTGISEDDLISAAGVIGSGEHLAFVYGETLDVNTLRKLVALAEKTGAAVVGVKGQANSLAAAQYRLDKSFKLNGHQAVYLALGDEDPAQTLVEAVQKAPFLAVQASYASTITEQADVVLPVETWSEQEGTYINLEGRVQRAVRSLQPMGDVRSNAAVLDELAGRLGAHLSGNWQQALMECPAPVAITFIPAE